MTRITVELIEPGREHEIRVGSDILVRDVLRELTGGDGYCLCLEGLDGEKRRLKGHLTLAENGVREEARLRFHPIERDPFVGRKEEIEGFREGLERLKTDPSTASPHVILVDGEAGMGKYTLIRQFERISQEVWPGGRSVYIDWKSERDKDSSRIHHDPVYDLRAPPDFLDPKRVLSVIAEKVGHTPQYDTVQREFDELTQCFVEARSEGKLKELLLGRYDEDKSGDLALIMMLSMGELAALIRKKELPPMSGVRPEKPNPAGLCRLAQIFVEACVADPELRALFNAQKDRFCEALGQDLRLSCGEDDLLLISLDSFDYVHSKTLIHYLFETVKVAGPRVVWVIASRQDLARHKPPPHQVAATYDLDVDRYSLAGLTREDVEEYLNTYQRWSLSTGGIDRIWEITGGNPQLLEFVVNLWEKGVDLGEISGGAPFREWVFDSIEDLERDKIEWDVICLLGMLLHRRRKVWCDEEWLQTVVDRRSDGEEPPSVDRVLEEIAWRYPFFQSQDVREDAAFRFLAEHLREERPAPCEELARIASEAIVDSLKSYASTSDLPVEERWRDEKWAEMVLDLIRFQFWISGLEGWQAFIPSFLEVLAYCSVWLNDLLEMLSFFQPRRYGPVSTGERSPGGGADIIEEREDGAHPWNRDAIVDMLVELKREEGWLEDLVRQGTYTGILGMRWSECSQGILMWLEGEWYSRRGEYEDALYFLRAARDSPPLCEVPRMPDQFVRSYLLIVEAIEETSAENWMHKLTICREMIDLDPDVLETYKYIAEIQYCIAELGAGGLGHWLRRIHLDTEFTLQYLLGKLHLALGRLSQAREAFERARFLKSEEPNPLFGLGAVYERQGARRQAQKYRSHAESLRHGKQAVHIYLGNLYFGARDYGRARDVYQQATTLIPDDEIAYLNLGNAYLRLGEERAAEMAYREACDIDADLALPYMQLGKICCRRGEVGEAIDLLEKARELGELSPQVFYWLGTAYYEQADECSQTLAAYQEAASADDAFALGHYGLGRAQFARGEFAESVDSFSAAVDRDPDEEVFHYYLCEAYRASGDRWKAQEICEERIELEGSDPEFAPLYRCLLGDLYLSMDPPAYADAGAEYEAALRSFRSGKLMQDQFPLGRLHQLLGQVCYHQYEYREAIQHFDQAAEHIVDDVWLHCHRGLARLGWACASGVDNPWLRQAARHLELAIACDADSPFLRRCLGAIYLRLREFDKARDGYQAAIGLEGQMEIGAPDPMVRLGMAGVCYQRDPVSAADWFREVAESYFAMAPGARSRCCYVMSRLGSGRKPGIDLSTWEQDLVAVSRAGDHHYIWEWLTLGQVFEEERDLAPLDSVILERYLNSLYEVSRGHLGAEHQLGLSEPPASVEELPLPSETRKPPGATGTYELGPILPSREEKNQAQGRIYSALATSRTPALIIYLLDVSGSAKKIGSGGTDVLTDALQESVIKMVQLSTKGRLVLPRYRIAMLAYGHQVIDLLGGIKSIVELAERGLPELAALDAPGTDAAAAFQQAENVLNAELPSLQNGPAPLIYHMTDGAYNGPDPEPVARRIMGMSVPDGNVLIKSIYTIPGRLSVSDARSWPGISSEDALPDPYARKLFRMSSPIPESYLNVMRALGYGLESEARMFFPGEVPELVRLGLPIGSSSELRMLGLDRSFE